MDEEKKELWRIVRQQQKFIADLLATTGISEYGETVTTGELLHRDADLRADYLSLKTRWGEN